MLKKYLPTLFALYMILLGGNFILYNLSLPVRILHHLLMTGVLVYWFFRHGLPNSPMLLPAAGVAAALVLSVVNALDPRMALENAWHWMINLGVFIMLLDWIRRGYGSHLFGGLFASGGATAGASGLQALLTPGVRVSGLFGIINLNGGMSSAMTTPALGWLVGAGRKRKLLLLALVAGQVLTIWQNGSRGAYISLGVALLVFIFPSIARKWHVALLAIPITLGVLAMVVAISLDPLHSGGDVLRKDLWRGAVQMVEARPATGVGVGLFAQVYRHISFLKGRPDIDGATGAHNLYLNVAAELGGAGVLAGGAFLLTAAYLLFKTRWTPQKLAVAAALAGMLSHMLVDNFPTQNYTFLVSLYAAFLLSDRRIAVGIPKVLGRTIGMGVLSFGLLMLQFDRAQVYYERSIQNDDMVAAMEAVELDPGMRLYRLNVHRLEKGLVLIWQMDATVDAKTNLKLYGLVSYGRVW